MPVSNIRTLLSIKGPIELPEVLLPTPLLVELLAIPYTQGTFSGAPTNARIGDSIRIMRHSTATQQLDVLAPAQAVDPSELTAADVELGLGSLEPETFPPRHNLHKYWGKKPANVFRQCIEFFSKPGELVLDPFSGSGVTVVESLIAGRTAIGYDVNPFAIELTSTMISYFSIERFSYRALDLLEPIRSRAQQVYGTRCQGCSAHVVPHSFGWDRDQLISVRYHCRSCRTKYDVQPHQDDLVKATADWEDAPGFPDQEMFYGWEMQKLRRANITRFSELFTRRNLLLLAELRQTIEAVPDTGLRAFLRLTFSANIAQCSRMIADYKERAGGPSWKINCYWLPDRWQELNVLHYFENRIRRTASAISDLQLNLPPGSAERATLCAQDGRSIQFENAPGSVDYILTDPPYGGEGIQYGELSMLWNLWLGYHQDLSTEVATNPYHGKTEDDYAQGLAEVFESCFRVLRPGRWMTITFNNKDPKVWHSLLTACRIAGFDLKLVQPLRRSAPALTEHVMKRAPKMDVLLHYQKPGLRGPSHSSVPEQRNFDFALCACDVARRLIERKGTVRTSAVLNNLTMEWLTYHSKFEDATDFPYQELTMTNVLKALRTDSTLQEVKRGQNSSKSKSEDPAWKSRTA